MYATRHLTLANGLQLVLRHAPHLKRAAAALRVHAGSHDAPAKWPGLAHFLEHLFFLGIDRFPLEDGLMRYVQSLGGQVNASTRERTTDFFFEVPPTALPGGLERLCQMLAEPDLGIERQVREREVIHAEFIAWSRNPEAQRHFALLQCVSARHPLSGFQAGNRHSLVLRDPAFQQALRQFHQQFYQGGQMTLALCGPQPLDALQAVGQRLGGLFADGQRIPQAMPPALLQGALRHLPPAGRRLDLLFAHENLPQGAEQALELLLAYLGDSRKGGWLAHLRQRGWLQGFQAEPLHAFAGQLLWSVRLQLSEEASQADIRTSLHSWLGFMRHADRATLNEAFARLQHSREQAASALDLARRDSAGHPFRALDAQGLEALRILLGSLPSSDSAHDHWRLAPPDPLLQAGLPRHSTAAPPAGLAISDLLPDTRRFAALYLRWQITSCLRQRFHPLLEQALRPLMERAERASIQLAFDAVGEYWQLRCTGRSEAVLRAVEESLALLRAPTLDNWQSPPTQGPALIPLRALLKALPDVLRNGEAQPTSAAPLDQALLDRLWQTARWQGLAVGFDQAGQAALGVTLGKLMGQPAHLQRPAPFHGLHWHHAQAEGSESALLLFCPLPAEQQAAGRLLAQLLQGPYYQRMRVELQLGYAVFSAFRQVEGVGGLLFGVQSPHASPTQILTHLLALLQEGVQLDSGVRQALAEQFAESAMANTDMAEWAWQTQLATQASDLSYMQRSILNTDQTHLDLLMQRLLAAEDGWLCLANAPAPDERWQ